MSSPATSPLSPSPSPPSPPSVAAVGTGRDAGVSKASKRLASDDSEVVVGDLDADEHAAGVKPGPAAPTANAPPPGKRPRIDPGLQDDALGDLEGDDENVADTNGSEWNNLGYGVVLQVEEDAFALFDAISGAPHLELIGHDQRYMKRQPVIEFMKWIAQEFETMGQFVLGFPMIELRFSTGTHLPKAVTLDELHEISRRECGSETLKVDLILEEQQNEHWLNRLKKKHLVKVGVSSDDPIMINDSDDDDNGAEEPLFTHGEVADGGAVDATNPDAPAASAHKAEAEEAEEAVPEEAAVADSSR